MPELKFDDRLERLPDDLRQAAPARALMRMAFEAVDAANWPRPLIPEGGRTPEPVLRTLLAFAYATGVYSSGEIVVLAKEDPDFRYLCSNDFPGFEEIRSFRRRYVSYLRETLARMIHAVWRSASPEGAHAESFFPYLAEADRRIRCAIEADSATMDV